GVGNHAPVVARFAVGPHGPAIDALDLPYGGCGFLHGPARIAVDAYTDDVRHAAAPETDDRRAARHRFGHDDAERFFPVDGHQKRRRAAEQRVLLFVVHGADVGHAVTIDMRSDFRV